MKKEQKKLVVNLIKKEIDKETQRRKKLNTQVNNLKRTITDFSMKTDSVSNLKK